MYKSILDPHKAPLEDLLAELGCGDSGLSGVEAKNRLRTYGANELKVRQTTPEIVKFLRQFKNFFALLLMVGGALALFAERLDPGQGNLYIAYALLGVVVLNAIFTYAQEHQSEKIMESFKKLLPSMATVQRDGDVQRIEARFLVPGDVIRLAEGDRIPADGRLIEESLLRVDISGLTGESEPQRLRVDAGNDRILDSRNVVFSGTLVQSGTGRALVVNTGMATQMGNIVKLTKETDEVPSPIHRELTHFIKVISSIAITLGGVFFLVSVGMGKDAIASLIFAIGIIVANVPEGLLPTVTLSLTMASKRMAAKMALIKNLESVETLGSTTVICTDKTGTLTQNKLAVSTLVLNGHEHPADSLAIFDERGLEDIWNVMTLCNNANLTEGGYAGDPTEGALLEFANGIRPITESCADFRIAEQPFDSTRKWMAVICPRPDGKGDRSYLKGAPEIVLDMCDRVLLDGEVLP
ncbi:MAG: cation-translocating P-type ATPase, partial [Alphaproteobacteria bacterium]